MKCGDCDLTGMHTGNVYGRPQQSSQRCPLATPSEVVGQRGWQRGKTICQLLIYSRQCGGPSNRRSLIVADEACDGRDDSSAQRRGLALGPRVSSVTQSRRRRSNQLKFISTTRCVRCRRQHVNAPTSPSLVVRAAPYVHPPELNCMWASVQYPPYRASTSCTHAYALHCCVPNPSLRHTDRTPCRSRAANSRQNGELAACGTLGSCGLPLASFRLQIRNIAACCLHTSMYACVPQQPAAGGEHAGACRSRQEHAGRPGEASCTHLDHIGHLGTCAGFAAPIRLQIFRSVEISMPHCTYIHAPTSTYLCACFACICM